MEDIEDFLAPKPQAPLPSECCGSGCSPCVYDIYEKELGKWKCKAKHTATDYDSVEQPIYCNKYNKFCLTDIKQQTYDTCIYTFQSFNAKSFKIPLGWHIILKGLFNNNCITRSYTPISDFSAEGKFDMLIKIYPTGKMSSIISEWKIGSTVEMRGPYGSFSYVVNLYKQILILVAGTGVAAVYRIIKYIIQNEDDYTKLHMMYASKAFDQILFREELYNLQSFWNFTVCHYLSQENCLLGKKYSENVVLNRILKKDVKLEVMKMEVGNASILISGPRSFEKDMINAILDANKLFESKIFRF